MREPRGPPLQSDRWHLPSLPRHNNEPRRGPRQGNLTGERAPVAPETVCVLVALPSFHYLKRLSATDISALASMKNVAKCDTWCELQNPVNHRVFERKLRPKPLGRGHACLGVTHRCPPPNPSHRKRGGDLAVGGYWPPVCRTARGWPKNESSATDVVTVGGRINLELPLRVRRRSVSNKAR